MKLIQVLKDRFNEIDSEETIEEIRGANSLINDPLIKIGFILRESREKKHLSINDIKELTHIPVHHIAAIESGDRNKLPEDLYLTGFIRRYAKALNLNDDSIVKKYIHGFSEMNKQNSQKDAFDSLFEKDNVVKLNTKNTSFEEDLLKPQFFQTYHLYLIIGIILFLVASALMISSFIKNQKSGNEIYQISSNEVVEEESDTEEAALDTDFAYDEDDIYQETQSAKKIANAEQSESPFEEEMQKSIQEEELKSEIAEQKQAEEVEIVTVQPPSQERTTEPASIVKTQNITQTSTQKPAAKPLPAASQTITQKTIVKPAQTATIVKPKPAAITTAKPSTKPVQTPVAKTVTQPAQKTVEKAPPKIEQKPVVKQETKVVETIQEEVEQPQPLRPQVEESVMLRPQVEE